MVIRSLILVAALVLFLPTVAPYDPMTTDTTQILMPPSVAHWLGTDGLGRDLLSRLLYGGRTTLLLTAFSTGLAVIPGCVLGIATGYQAGLLDRLAKLVTNTLLSVPGLLIAFVSVTLLGRGYIGLILGVALAHIAPAMQSARAATIGTRHAAYIEAAVALGARQRYIMRAHVLPNILPLLLATLTLSFGYCLLMIGALGYLGIAGQPGEPEWGAMLAEGRAVLREAVWVSAVPGIAMTIIMLLVNALADRFTRRG
ncbi:MAG: ABC transporter permease [Armatimonadetes bacterium]|nr:ABC transporter permease [Anaerolineae bacterium]